MLTDLEIPLKKPSQLLQRRLTPPGRVGTDPELPLALQMLRSHEVGVFFLAQLVEHAGDEASCVQCVGAHMAHDHFDRDVAGDVPALG